jgi:MOSC domain-containing protein YiiM
MATRVARVLSVNVGTVREFEYNGRPAKSAIWKSPVAGRIAARGVNLDGDAQADREAHGGPDKAIYAYAVEDAPRRPIASECCLKDLATMGCPRTSSAVVARIGE